MRLKQMLRRITGVLEVVDSWVVLLTTFLALMWTLVVVVKAIAPLVTAVVAIGLTAGALKERQVVMVVSGILLYLASWLIVRPYGPFAAAAMCSFGVLLWFVGIYRAFVPLQQATSS